MWDEGDFTSVREQIGRLARWDGTGSRGRVVPAGVYFVRLNTGGETTSRRVTLIR